jgi:hypothetical protein
MRQFTLRSNRLNITARRCKDLAAMSIPALKVRDPIEIKTRGADRLATPKVCIREMGFERG